METKPESLLQKAKILHLKYYYPTTCGIFSIFTRLKQF